jgi:hypothetical protein
LIAAFSGGVLTSQRGNRQRGNQMKTKIKKAAPRGRGL